MIEKHQARSLAETLGPKYRNDPLDYTNRKGLVRISESPDFTDKSEKHY
jgi:hypothetical protein